MSLHNLLTHRRGQPYVHDTVRELMREDVTPSVPWVAVKIDKILLAARGLDAAHTASALVQRDALLARVSAVYALHVRVLRQIARALADPNDVECGAASCKALVHRHRHVTEHSRQAIGGGDERTVGYSLVCAYWQAKHHDLFAEEALLQGREPLHSSRCEALPLILGQHTAIRIGGRSRRCAGEQQPGARRRCCRPRRRPQQASGAAEPHGLLFQRRTPGKEDGVGVVCV